MKILVIRFSAIGDIVLMTPVIRCLKKQLPGAEIHFLTKKSFKAVSEYNPYIDRFHYFDNNLDELIADLKREKFDYIIDLHKNLRTYRIRLALWRVKVLSYRKLSVEKFILTKFHLNLMPGKHITQRSLAAVASLGVHDDGYGLDFFYPPEKGIQEGDLPLSHSQGFVAIVIGASYATKKLPVDKLKILCQTLEFPIVLVGGKEEREEGDDIATVDNVKVYNACGKFSLFESADIIRKANLVVSHDTGMQYIACAFNKRVIAIWGATSPKLDVEPYYGAAFLKFQAKAPHHNILVPGLSCQPCSNFGTTTCPRKHFKCMKTMDMNLIRRQIENSLK